MLPINLLQQEKEKVDNLAQKLDPYYQRYAKDLPEDLLKKINSLQTYKQITSSGLEKVKEILIDLYVLSFTLEKAIENPDEFQKTYGEQKQTPSSDSNVKETQTQSIPSQVTKTDQPNQISTTDENQKINIKLAQNTAQASQIPNSQIKTSPQEQASQKIKIDIKEPSSQTAQLPISEESPKDSSPEDLTPPPASKIEL